jgi:ribosomal protein L17
MSQVKIRVPVQTAPSADPERERKKRHRQERESKIIQEAIETRSICLEMENLEEISGTVSWLFSMRKVAVVHGWKSVVEQIDVRLENVQKIFEEIRKIFNKNLV